MSKFRFILKLLSGIAISHLWATLAYAYPNGACFPSDGGVPINHRYNISRVITNASDNIIGYTAPPMISTSPGTFSLTCQCNTGPVSTHQWTTTTLPVAIKINELTYYRINEYLSAAVELDEHNTFYPTPWVDNYHPTSTIPCNTSQGGFGTGGYARITFRIEKPFVGVTVIDNINMMQVWYTTGPTFVQGAPVANIMVSGTITVPQNCTLNAGQIVTVDFGNIGSGKFKTKGQKPEGINPETINFPVTCSGGVEAMANLTARFQSSADANYPDAISSDNADVGVVVTDTLDRIIKPNTGLIPFSLKDSQAEVSFKVYPVSTTGKPPVAGKFTSLAYIRVDFA